MDAKQTRESLTFRSEYAQELVLEAWEQGKVEAATGGEHLPLKRVRSLQGPNPFYLYVRIRTREGSASFRHSKLWGILRDPANRSWPTGTTSKMPKKQLLSPMAYCATTI